MPDEQIARILRAAPALEGAHQQVACLASDSEQHTDCNGDCPVEFDIEARESRTALDPVGHPRDSRDGTGNATFPSLLGTNARGKRMTPEGALACRKLTEEICHRVAEPHGGHHEDKRIAVFKALAVAHHHHVHAAPKANVERGRQLHYEPREQMVDIHLRIGNSDVDRKEHDEGHAHYIRHGRQTEITALRERPRKRQRKRRCEREVTDVRPLVHLGGHACPFPGTHARKETHQPDTAVVAEPQQEEHYRNGDKRRNQTLSQVTHAAPSQISVLES